MPHVIMCKKLLYQTGPVCASCNMSAGMQVHQLVEQYMDKCSLSAAEQAMQDLKETNTAELAALSYEAGPSRSPAQPPGRHPCHRHSTVDGTCWCHCRDN